MAILTTKYLAFPMSHRNGSIPDGAAVCDNDENFKLTSSDLNARTQSLAKALNQFWNRWRDKYLLRERYSNKENAKANSAPVIGEVVLIHEEGLTVETG